MSTNTNDALALLEEVARHGGRLVLPGGDRVRYEAPEPLPADLLDRLRERKAELLALLRERQEAADKAEKAQRSDGIEKAPAPGGMKIDHFAALRVPQEGGAAEKPASAYTNYGKGYRHPDGRVESGQPEPMPRPTVGWPKDLDALLNRVATAFEWLQSDVTEFRQWARRSPEGLADARAFLEAESAKLPQPGLDARRRFVMERLAADPALRVAWTCADDGADPVILTLAIRGKGTCDLAIPRAKFNALALPDLIGQLTTQEDAS